MRLDIPLLINLIAQSLPLKNWGFIESAKTDTVVIYNSQWCRIKFLIEKDRSRDHLHIYYGRLHAPDNLWIMNRNGESCYCWHDHFDLQRALDFLDDVSPQDAYKKRLGPLPLFQDFYNSEFSKSIDSIEERLLKLHYIIWSKYGTRFFELFDLRQPDLWEQYINFLKEYYRFDDEESDAAYKRNGLPRDPVALPRYKKC